MGFTFRVQKAVQAVACLLKLSSGRRMDTIAVLKLLYLADRESLKEGANPILGDRAVAMQHGPVLSRTYDLSKTPDDWDYKDDEEKCWLSHFSREGHSLCLSIDPGDDELSPHEIGVIERVYAEFHHLQTWDLVEHTHQLPEWEKNYVQGTSTGIPLRDILEAVGRSDDADAVQQAKREDEYFAELFG